MHVRKLIIALAAAIGIGGAIFAAVPAMAACTPGTGDAVNECASVSSELTLTGLTSAIDFGNVQIGQTNAVTGAEAYSVTTNNPDGYTLTITPADDGLETADQNALIPNTDISVIETDTNPGTYTFSSTNTVQVGADSNPGTDSYAENWSVKVPASQAPGDYSQTFTYAVVAS